MYAVKRETEEVPCHGCLSTDRNLSPLADHDLYSSLLGIKQSGEEYKYLSILLCWECLALLRRTQAFRRRLQNAQEALALTYRKKSTDSLSTLNFSHKQNFDCIIEETKTKPEEFPRKLEIIVKQELEIDTYEPDDYKDNDELLDEKNTEPVKKRKYQWHKERKRAEKVENTIDMSDLEKYFSKTCLSEKEVEEILEKEREGDELRLHQCGTCRIRFLSKTELYNHRKQNHRRRSTYGKCPHCSFTYRTQWDLQLHWWRSHPVNRCSLCGYVSMRDSEKRQHLERHRFRYRCTKCGIDFDNYQLYQYHDKQLHSRYICDHCGRNSACKTSLLKHIVRQHLPNKCPECPQVFDSYQRLSRHRRLVHAWGEQAYCVECDATFPNVTKYRRHLSTARRHRAPVRVSIPCPECGKTFTRKNYLNNHIKLFHSNESRHHCPLCNKYFVNGFSLRCHNTRVHEKIPLPKTKICKVCGRGFGTNRVLENHMRTHTGERPFSCAHCPAAFAQRVALRAHLAAVHKERGAVGVGPVGVVS